MLIKRHISKRQLKRPEGEEAIRAHLYVDERESVDRPCIRIQRGRSLASAAKYALLERVRAVATEEREGEGARWQWLEGREGGRMVLFTIHPFLFYIVPKKNKRTNTFLNKGRALEVEAHWGYKGAPLWVTTEQNQDATELPTPPALLSHLPKQKRPSTQALISEEAPPNEAMGYAVPSYSEGHCTSAAFQTETPTQKDCPLT